VKVAIEGTCRPCNSEVDRKNLKHARHHSAILATYPSEKELPKSSDLLRHNCHDVWHSSTFPTIETRLCPLPPNAPF
jgi:hypothetical protein